MIPSNIYEDDDWYMPDPITQERDLRRTKLLSAKEVMDPLSYVLDYQLDSSRGFNRYLVRSTIRNKKLYIFTIQCDQNSFEGDPTIRETAEKLIESFQLTDT